jgi:heterodisulfide reductase subunit B
MISMASTSQEQEAVVVPVNVDVRNSEDIVDFLINKCRFCKLSYEDKFYFMYIKQLKRGDSKLRTDAGKRIKGA